MSLFYYYEDAIHNSKNDIDTKRDEFLLPVDSINLLNYYCESNDLPLIERDSSREIEYRQEKTGYSETLIKILYPIIPKNKLENVVNMQAQTYLLNFGLGISGSSLITSVSVNLSSEESSSNRIKQAIEYIDQTIAYKNKSVKEGNERLHNDLLAFIENKKKKLQSDQSALERIIKKVPIVLQKRTYSTPIVPIKVKDTIKPIYPTAQVLTEPVLEKEKVNLVISLIESGGYSFETTPSVYSILEEEALRDILLSQLNCVFQGDATGETFVKKGKTDIHLKMEKGSILSMECKFWEGEKHYLETIDQLLGYLTWRQDYGIVITFCKRENFTETIDKAKEASRSHPSTGLDTLRVLSASHFATTNKIPEDNLKNVTVHHLFFNLYLKRVNK